jgi:hypothetical protein
VCCEFLLDTKFPSIFQSSVLGNFKNCAPQAKKVLETLP